METKLLKGEDISTVGIHYENIAVRDNLGELHYIHQDELLRIMRNFDFLSQVKRTRKWIRIA